MSAPEEKQNTQRQQRNNQRRHFNRKPRQQGDQNKTAQGESQGGTHVRRESFNRNKPQHKKNKQNNQQQPQQQSRAFVPVGEPESITGILEITAKGFGFIRTADNDWAPSDSAIYVPADIITELRLRPFVQLTGMAQKYERGHQLVSVQKVNGMEPAEAAACPHFEDLKAVNPTHRLSFETTPSRFTTRTLDLMAPVARGQRGLIVAPPRTGKTTLLNHVLANQEGYKVAVIVNDIGEINMPFTAFVDDMKAMGEAEGLDIRTMHEDIFNTMHKI